MKTPHLKRKIKGLFFLMRLHRLIPYRLLGDIYWLCELSSWINHNSKGGYYCSDYDYQRRYDIYRSVIIGLNQPIDFFEFGVSEGHSFRFWQSNIHDNSSFFGFDTFTGIPEEWGFFKKGDMRSEIPDIKDDRCHFYKGLFIETLPQFLKTYSVSRQKIIHMDADLYGSTSYVLMTLIPLLREGDIIIFDEFNVPQHEFKAFSLWQQFIKYRLLYAVNNFHQIAIQII